MLQVFAFGAGRDAERIDDPQRISDLVAEEGRLVWVDLVTPTEAELRLVEAEFSLDPHAMEDVSKHGQRPKLEHYPTHAFIVAFASGPDPRHLPEVDIFVGPQWLVTVREADVAVSHFDIEAVRERHDRSRDPAPSVGFLLWTVLDELVDGFFDGLDAAEDHLEALEDVIFRSNGELTMGPDIQRQILDLRGDLVMLRRRIVPMRDVVMAILRREIPWVDGDNLVHFQDVLDHLLRIIDQTDTLRELLGNAVDAHLGLVGNELGLAANRTNDIMKKTSSWGAILLGSTLIAGIYGMNFRNMPELGWHLGYFGALGTMAMLTVFLVWYFRRKDWL